MAAAPETQTAVQRALRVPGRAARALVSAIAAPLHAARRLVYPPACLVCDADLQSGDARFCAACLNEIVSIDVATCPRCAAAVGPFTDTSDGCPRCRKQHLRFDAALRLGHYDGALRRLCLDFKSIHNALLGPALAREFLRCHDDKLRAAGANLVVAVPLHFVRRLSRGFNQAELLARHLAGALNLPHRSRILTRVRRTRPQAGLAREDRLDNVRGAFRAKPVAALRGATVLLVDDILTTGATCSEAARALKEAGAARVVVAVVARSQEHPGA